MGKKYLMFGVWCPETSGHQTPPGPIITPRPPFEIPANPFQAF